MQHKNAVVPHYETQFQYNTSVGFQEGALGCCLPITCSLCACINGNWTTIKNNSHDWYLFSLWTKREQDVKSVDCSVAISLFPVPESRLLIVLKSACGAGILSESLQWI